MNRTTQFRWLMTMLALVAALVVAGTALGGVSQEAGPLEEPTLPPPTATETLTPSATPTSTTEPASRLWLSPAVLHLAPGETQWLYLVAENVENLYWAEVWIGGNALTIDFEPAAYPWEPLGFPPPDTMDVNGAEAGTAYFRLYGSPVSGTGNMARIQVRSLSDAPSEIDYLWTALRATSGSGWVEIDHSLGTCQVNPPTPTPSPTATASPTAEPAHLSFSPSVSHLDIGEEAWIEIRISRAVDVDGVDLWLSYEPSFLEIVPVSGAPFVAGDFFTPPFLVSINHDDGTPHFVQLHILPAPGASGDGLICKFLARGLEDGVSPLALVDTIIATGGVELPITKSGGLITVGTGMTPTPTATPTVTPTPTLGSRMVHGTVLDPAGAPVPNAALTLYRYSNTAWTHKAAGTSGADGVFRLWTNPIPGDWKLVVAPPAGYAASSAALPEGVSGQVVSADTLAFALGGEPGQIGAFRYVVAAGPTATPTPSPQPTLPLVVLQGRVTWNGVGLAGVQVTLSPGGLSSVQTTVTDDEGYYAFVVDGAGEYVVSIHDPEGRVEDASRAVDTAAWEPGPIDWGQWEGWLPWVTIGK